MARSGCLFGEMLPGKFVIGSALVDMILLPVGHVGISILMATSYSFWWLECFLHSTGLPL